MKTLKVIGRTVADTAINMVSAGIGIGAFVYVSEHDVLNDPELSLIAGASVGAGAGTVVHSVLKTCQYHIGKAVTK